MALHLAAMGNHVEAVDFLADTGLDYCRQISNDVIAVTPGGSFLQLAREVFAALPLQKLSYSETQRFEKSWLADAVAVFLERADPSVRRRLPPPNNSQVIGDVLARFDPRPETGIFVLSGATRDEKFIPTIEEAGDLAVLIKYVFRQVSYHRS
jgi:hypothetical protein